MNNRLQGASGRAQFRGNPLGRLLAAIAGIATLVLALMFSAVIIVFLLIAGLLVWIWFRWKTRGLRRQMDEFSARAEEMRSRSFESGDARGEIIEGEAVRVDERQ